MKRAPSPRSTGKREGDVYVALLRGVNVGGKNALPMKELVALATELGATEVAHYIQSGNLLYRADRGLAKRLGPRLATEIEARFGFRAPVIVRNREALELVVASNPFVSAGADPATLHVAFLADEPDEARVARLDGRRSPPDAFEVRGREIYLCCPNGLARTKLTNAYFDTTLVTTSTLRSWKTVQTLLALMGSAAGHQGANPQRLPTHR